MSTKLIVVFCIVSCLYLCVALLCFCNATEFSVNKDLYKISVNYTQHHQWRFYAGAGGGGTGPSKSWLSPQI